MEKLRHIIRHPKFIDGILAVGLTLSLSMMGLLFYNSYRVFSLLAKETHRKIELVELKSEIGKNLELFSRYSEMYLTNQGKYYYDRRLALQSKIDSEFVDFHSFMQGQQMFLYDNIMKEWTLIKEVSDHLTGHNTSATLSLKSDSLLGQEFQDALNYLQEKVFLISPPNEEELLLADLSCELAYRDEAINSFALHYVKTRSPGWMIRYRSYGHQMDNILAKLNILLPNNESVRILQNANDELSKIEARAFFLAESRDTLAAINTLNNQNAQYHRGRLANSIQAIQKLYRDKLTATSKSNTTRETFRIVTGFVFLVFSWLLLGVILRLRRQLQERNKELTKKNRDLEQFAYAVSHDLKAPIRVIGGLSGIIERTEGHRLTEEGKENFAMIREQTEQMNKMINGVLEYARAAHSAGLAEKVNPNEVVEEIVKPYKTLSDIQFEVQEKMPNVFAPRATVVQIFQNIINNALKYNDKEVAVIKIEASLNGKFVQFSIADNGPGIEPQYSETIFKLFDTLAPKSTESTGVGLAIVKKYVEDLEGAIYLDTQYENGAKFVFSLPKQ